MKGLTREEQRLLAQRRLRVARTKRLLRWLPRRNNIHRIPVLKWFKVEARKRPYLWSFRSGPVVKSLYAGFLLCFSPLLGLQTPIGILLAFAMRANLPLMIAIQWITNPVTSIPIYYAQYQIGKIVMHLLGLNVPILDLTTVESFIRSFPFGDWQTQGHNVVAVLVPITIGGLMLGLFVATLLSLLYRASAWEITHSYKRLKELQLRREERQRAQAAENPSPDPPPAPPVTHP